VCHSAVLGLGVIEVAGWPLSFYSFDLFVSTAKRTAIGTACRGCFPGQNAHTSQVMARRAQRVKGRKLVEQVPLES